MIHNCILQIAHQADPKFIKLVWWYSILEDKFEGYDLSKVEKHSSSKFTLTNNDTTKFARGKVVLFNDKYYLMIWTPGYHLYPVGIIEKIKFWVDKDFDINYIVDEQGIDLLY